MTTKLPFYGINGDEVCEDCLIAVNCNSPCGKIQLAARSEILRLHGYELQLKDKTIVHNFVVHKLYFASCPICGCEKARQTSQSIEMHPDASIPLIQCRFCKSEIGHHDNMFHLDNHDIDLKLLHNIFRVKTTFQHLKQMCIERKLFEFKESEYAI